MKIFLKIGIIVMGISILFGMGYKVISKVLYKSEIQKVLETIPDFSFKTLEGELFTNKDLKSEVATVFIYFNSECGYCETEAELIEKNIAQFENNQIIFISDEPKYKIDTFSRQYKLDIYDNITFLFDQKDEFATRFDATSVPYLLVYNKDQKITKRHKGILNIKSLLEFLHNG